MLVRDADIAGRRRDVRIEGQAITQIADRLKSNPHEEILDAAGGALLPGLQDHHLHLLSLAAQSESVDCGPPEVESEEALARALARARPDETQGWIRGTGYFESVAGPLDRNRLDRYRRDRPVRIQHRSGVYWFLNSRACEVLELDRREAGPGGIESTPQGVERDETGRATGRLFRLDDWLRKRMAETAAGGSASRSVAGDNDPDRLARMGKRLASFGVTGLTDATPSNGPDEIDFFRRAQETGALPQRLFVLGDRSLESLDAASPALHLGAHKIMLDDAALPSLDALTKRIREAHLAARPVAIHTVTRAEILFALAALEAAGSLPGDRLEHASVTPPEAVASIASLGLRIVTQPHFVAERGDAYLEEVDAVDQPFLYRLQDWHRAGVPLAGGTDAPFGHPDPWRAMRAAVERRTRSGRLLGSEQALTPEQALALFTSSAGDPGGAPRVVAPGAPADLCLLDRPWSRARQRLDSKHVRATLIAGRLVWQAAAAKAADPR